MGVKALIFFISVIVLMSACSIKEKTKPVVTDISEEAKQEKPAEIKEEIKQNETIKEEKEIKTIEKEEEKPIAKTHSIIIRDLKLNPQELTIKKGDTVIWKHEDQYENGGETKHYLYEHRNEFRSPTLYYGDEFTHTFNKTGTFIYNDAIYKDKEYMRGKIVVE